MAEKKEMKPTGKTKKKPIVIKTRDELAATVAKQSTIIKGKNKKLTESDNEISLLQSALRDEQNANKKLRSERTDLKGAVEKLKVKNSTITQNNEQMSSTINSVCRTFDAILISKFDTHPNYPREVRCSCQATPESPEVKFLQHIKEVLSCCTIQTEPAHVGHYHNDFFTRR